MPRLVLTLLGGFQARRESGEPVELPSRKAQALLAFLAMPPGVAHPRDKLTALLWPELAATPARANLRQVLFALRRALAFADPLRLDADAVTLDASSVDVDTAAFERALREAPPAELAAALTRYQGDLLAGLRVQEAPYEEWLTAERGRLRECALEGLARSLAHRRSAGDLNGAVQSALRLLAIDPLHEPAHRALMRLYASLGRRADALRQYHVCVTSLRRDLDVDPEIETKELYQTILRSPAGGQGGAGAETPADDRVDLRWRAVDDVALVGRAAERVLLADAVNAAWSNRPRGIALTGEPGIGKSRLASELIGQVMERGGRVIAGRAFETEQVLPFRPWIDALRSGGMTRDRQLLEALTPLHRAALCHVFPEIGAGGIPAGAFDFLRLFEAIAALIQLSAARQPLLVVLEDLHWADEMSLRLLPFLWRQFRDDAVLVVLTLREGEPAATPVLQHTLDELRRDGRVTLCSIGALSRTESTLLATAVLPQVAWSLALDEQIWLASRGNPFIIVETLRALGAGALGADEGVTLPVATAVRELVTRQLDRLGESGRRVATAAAVIGQEFDFALLPGVAGLDEEQVAEAVEELVRLRVLRETGGRFELVHDRVRQIVYEQMLPHRRSLLHRRVAAAIRAVHADELAPHVTALATHYRLAGAWHEAAEFLEKAGLAAAAHSAHRDAASLFAQALQALAKLADTPDTIRRAAELEFRRGYSLAHTGRFERALERYDASVALAERLDAGPLLWFARGARASVLGSMGRYAEAFAVVDQALSGMADGDHRGRFWCHIQLARITNALGRYHQSAEHCRHAEDSLRRAPSMEGVGPDFPPGVAWRTWLLRNLVTLGRFGEGEVVAEELAALGVAGNDVNTHGHILVNGCIGLFHAARGEWEPAATVLEPMVEICRRADTILLLATMAGPLGRTYVLTGRAGDAISLLEDALARARAAHYSMVVEELEIRLGEAYLGSGRASDAQQALSTALHRARAAGAGGMEAEALRALGSLAANRPAPDLELAVAHIDAAARAAERLGMRPLSAQSALEMGRVRQLQGRRDDARSLLHRAARHFQAMGMAFWLSQAETAIASLG